jgi:hypothetical protein
MIPEPQTLFIRQAPEDIFIDELIFQVFKALELFTPAKDLKLNPVSGL